MRRLVIFDFDGTMTDAEREGVPFRAGYLEDLAVLTGRPLQEIVALAGAFEAEIAADSGRYGWMFEGRIVAPASVDPYLRIMPVARRILDHFGCMTSETDRSRLLDGILYKYNYQKTVVAFRPGALELLLALHDQPDTALYVVTNSHTEPVQQKIARLGARADGSNALEWLLEGVHGRARKYIIDDTFDAVPPSVSVPGLERPILLRRRHYAEAIEALRARHGLAWDRVWVVGDIFELDLALPLTLGANGMLVTNAHTPAYEVAYLSGHPRGRVVPSLEAARELLVSP